MAGHAQGYPVICCGHFGRCDDEHTLAQGRVLDHCHFAMAFDRASMEFCRVACDGASAGRLLRRHRGSTGFFLGSGCAPGLGLCELYLALEALWCGKRLLLCAGTDFKLLECMDGRERNLRLVRWVRCHPDRALSVGRGASGHFIDRRFPAAVEEDGAGDTPLLALWMGFVAIGISSKGHLPPGPRSASADYHLRLSSRRTTRKDCQSSFASPYHKRLLFMRIQLVARVSGDAQGGDACGPRSDVHDRSGNHVSARAHLSW